MPEDIDHNSQKYYIFVQKFNVLCLSDTSWSPIADRSLPPELIHATKSEEPIEIGEFNGLTCFAVDMTRQPEPKAPYSYLHLRLVLLEVDDDRFALASRAVQFARWQREHQFCGACGAKTIVFEVNKSRYCESCEIAFYPRISPCVIGLVVKENQFLLARSHRMPENIYSTLAGFVEPGENAEQAFAREVHEEVGIHIKNLQYFGSQAWPFPGQLMIGFIAEYQSGEIVLEEAEIADANWYTLENMPDIPPKQTISGQIIRHHCHVLLDEAS